MSTVRVAVLGGGRSSEHEVSLASAASVRAGLEQAGHVPIAIEIGRDGVWRRDGAIVAVEPGRGLAGVDVVFPVLHGPFGEDGTVQGLLECLDVPYVGAGVLSSALCMDKVMFKELMAHAALPQVRYRAVRAEEFATERESVLADLRSLGMPVFVKPARLGSSVGIVRAATEAELPAALETAFEHDPLAIVEAAAGGLEVECSVLGDSDPIASEPGEIVLAKGESGWYDYEAKYTPGGMQLIVPARVPDRVRERIREIAVSAFVRTGCYGTGPRRLLRRRGARAPQRAQHDAGLHQHERVRVAVRGQRDRLRGAARPPRAAGARAPRRRGAPPALTGARSPHSASAVARVKLVRMSEIESVAVVGAGFMGTGIAEAVAVAGIPVIVRDVDDASLGRAAERIDSSLSRAVRGGKLEASDAGAVRERIELTTRLETIGEADLVIEAVPEDEQLKLRVMRSIAEVVSDDAIVASNTSSIPIAELAQAIRTPERVLGLHFFSPVPVMTLVEVVVALDTNESTIDRAKQFVLKLGKRPIETKDRSGFIVNMLLVPYLMAAVRMYEERFASREDIDNGMKLGCGHPMGPLTLCDFIGLDVLYAVCDSLYEEFKRDEYAPPPLLKRMVASGRLGRKSGRGFYDYG